MHSAQEKCWKWLLAQKILALHKKFAVRSGIRKGVEPCNRSVTAACFRSRPLIAEQILCVAIDASPTLDAGQSCNWTASRPSIIAPSPSSCATWRYAFPSAEVQDYAQYQLQPAVPEGGGNSISSQPAPEGQPSQGESHHHIGRSPSMKLDGRRQRSHTTGHRPR